MFGYRDDIKEDYADARPQGPLGLPGVPRVFLISAISPERYELPQLRQMLAQQKSDESVRHSKELAAARQDRTLLAWVDEQALPQRAERLARLQQDAEELIAERVTDNLSAGRGHVPQWLELAAPAKSGTVRSLPLRDDIQIPVQEQLIVELYSK